MALHTAVEECAKFDKDLQTKVDLATDVAQQWLVSASLPPGPSASPVCSTKKGNIHDTIFTYSWTMRKQETGNIYSICTV